MSRSPDKTSSGDSPTVTKDKETDYRMFSERGKSDKAYASYEGDRMVSELEGDAPLDNRTDQDKLRWATDVLRGLIDNKWW